MTTAYMTRATYLTFFGKARGAAAGHSDHGDDAEEHELEHADDHAPVLAMAHAAHGHDDHDAHGAHDDHAAHHKPAFGIKGESPILLVFPIAILGVLAVVSGYINAAPFHIEKFLEWVEPRGGEYAPTIDHATFTWAKAMPSIILMTKHLQLGLRAAGSGIAVTGQIDDPTAGALIELVGPDWHQVTWYELFRAATEAKRTRSLKQRAGLELHLGDVAEIVEL
jgi:NADH:ubiquinone oxidoreductase subunit 5 (subunit L)/multisubunit Na+/H+ antiporter MnhA subunit